MKHVSFPFVVLSKSAKVIPVIIVGAIRGVYKPTTKQYFIAFFISLGLIIFNMDKVSSNQIIILQILANKPKDPTAQSSGQYTFGLVLVFSSLAFDGLTQTQTDKQHKSSKRDFAYPGMLSNNLVGLLLSMALYGYAVTTHGDDTHVRILGSEELMFKCLVWGMSGCLGQIFIFLTISLFDCYLLTIFTTTRKFFSVVYSNFLFGHNFSGFQWLGASIVCACTIAELVGKKAKKEGAKKGETPQTEEAEQIKKTN